MSSLRLTRELPNCKVGVGVLRPLVEKHSILWIWYNIEHSSKNLHNYYMYTQSFMCLKNQMVTEF